jgi:hypothetical protein
MNQLMYLLVGLEDNIYPDVEEIEIDYLVSHHRLDIDEDRQ